MPRPVILYSGKWSHLPLEQFAPMVSEWGYDGIELCCWGEHFEIQRAVSEEQYGRKLVEILADCDLEIYALGVYRVSQAICDRVDERHAELLPDYVWADGNPQAVSDRAVEEVVAAIEAAEQLGVGVISGFSGSPLWSYVCGYPPASEAIIHAGFERFAERFTPILDACAAAGVRYALEVHPGQLAFDLYTAEMVLDAVDGRDELGFTFDPSHLYWQGVDPSAFLRRFPERIYHVHIKDGVVSLDGRRSLLNSYAPPGNSRRGWDYRSPGRGGIDWESIIRTLDDIGYEGPLTVEWQDPLMDPDYGAEEACQFVRRLDFPTRAGEDT